MQLILTKDEACDRLRSVAGSKGLAVTSTWGEDEEETESLIDSPLEGAHVDLDAPFEDVRFTLCVGKSDYWASILFRLNPRQATVSRIKLSKNQPPHLSLTGPGYDCKLAEAKINTMFEHASIALKKEHGCFWRNLYNKPGAGFLYQYPQLYSSNRPPVEVLDSSQPLLALRTYRKPDEEKTEYVHADISVGTRGTSRCLLGNEARFRQSLSLLEKTANLFLHSVYLSIHYPSENPAYSPGSRIVRA